MFICAIGASGARSGGSSLFSARSTSGAFSLCSALLLLLSVVSAAEAESLRATAVDFLDRGSFAESSATDLGIDLLQGLCGESPSQTQEPFFDTYVSIQVKNPFPLDLTVTGLRYQLKTSPSERALISRRFPPAAGSLILKQSTGRVLGIFLKADSGRKKVAGGSTLLSASLGVQRVSLFLTLRSSSGKAYKLKKSTSMAFGDYDRCAE